MPSESNSRITCGPVSVMKKFDETGAWNLPVINEGEYVGFISKSSIFANYRSKLIDNSIE